MNSHNALHRISWYGDVLNPRTPAAARQTEKPHNIAGRLPCLSAMFAHAGATTASTIIMIPSAVPDTSPIRSALTPQEGAETAAVTQGNICMYAQASEMRNTNIGKRAFHGMASDMLRCFSGGGESECGWNNRSSSWVNGGSDEDMRGKGDATR